MRSKLREKAIALRRRELSYGEIKRQLGVPKSTLSYWLRDFPLDEHRIRELRQRGWRRGEAGREKFRATMRLKREHKEEKIYHREQLKLAGLSRNSLYIAGLMLYLAEGGKTNRARVSFANTDVRIIRFFVYWLHKFFSIPREHVRAQLHLYANMNIPSEEKYWLDQLGFERGQLYKTQVRSLRPESFSYQDTSRHGTCSIFLPNTATMTRISMAIRAFLDIYMPNPRH